MDEPDLWSELGFRGDPTARFARCVLHIGTEKTGTTTLQRFLAANRGALLEAGFVVPLSLARQEGLANHERLTTYALADAKLNDDLRIAENIITPAAVLRHRAAVAEALRTECSLLPLGPARTLLLSNEHCHSRLIDRAELERLQTLLAAFADAVTIIVYLRPQHELAISLYDQALKAGYADISMLPDFSGRTRRWVHRGFFDYADLLDRWSAIFGAAAIDVRLYTQDDLVGGSVVDDFLSRLNLAGAGFTPVPNSNLAMDAARQVALNAINRYVQARGEPLSPGQRARLIDSLQRRSSGTGLRPGRKAAKAFFDSFAASNEQVRAGWRPERPALFTPDFSAYAPHPAPPDEIEALAASLVAQLG